MIYGSGLFAQDFRPFEGTAIATEQVDVNWFSVADEQWLRAFDDDTGVKFYDSGRLSERFGQLSLAIPSGISNLKLIFFEKVLGNWTSIERLYPVVLGSGDGDDLCPPAYLDHLRAVENFQQPLSDGSGGAISISKEVETQAFFGEGTEYCTVEWGYSLSVPDSDRARHIFRRSLSVDGGLPIQAIFSALVFNRAIRQEIEIEYIGGSDGFGGTPFRPGTFYIPVTAKQWETCGIVAGCDFSDL